MDSPQGSRNSLDVSLGWEFLGTTVNPIFFASHSGEVLWFNDAAGRYLEINHQIGPINLFEILPRDKAQHRRLMLSEVRRSGKDVEFVDFHQNWWQVQIRATKQTDVFVIWQRAIDQQIKAEEGLRQSLMRAVTIQEDERRRISRDLHDETGQALTGLILELRELSRRVEEPDVRMRVDRAAEMATTLMKLTRGILHQLNPPSLKSKSFDAGTTGVRAVAVRDDCTIAGVAYRELQQHFPRPAWVEHDASEIWRAVQATIAAVVHDLQEPVAAVGITNQRETIVAWSRKTGEPHCRAIVWQDRRTAQDCRVLLEAGHLRSVKAATGLGLDPYFSATKIAWLLQNSGLPVTPDLAIGTIDSWIAWNLTAGAEFVTEPSNASRTLLFDINKLEWSPDLCALFDVPISAFPEIRPSSGRVGLSAHTTALGAGIPLSGIAGDQQAALFGQACFRPGMTKNTYGTGSFLLMNVGDIRPPDVDGLLTTVAWTLGQGSAPTYAYEGSVFATGAVIQWLRDGLGIIQDAQEIGPLAESVESTGDVYLVPAFAGLGSPWWDPSARGAIVGLTRGTGRAEIALAAVESMAFQVRGVVDTMIESTHTDLSELRVDGGASAIDLLLQLQADQLGVRVTRAATTEATALGAAYLAGLAEGVWSSLDEISSIWSADCTVVPSDDRSSADIKYARWRQAVGRSLGWAPESLN